MDEVAAELRDAGRRPAVLPFGGSTPLATNAYLDVAREIQAQGVDPEHVVVAVGSGGTMAGLVRGFGTERVLGVHCGAVTDPHWAVRELFPAGAGVADDLRIRCDQVGPGYGRVTDAVMGALTLAGQTEGIVLDPVYTGRALAGLIAEIEDGEIDQGATVVMMHTGGLPGLLATASSSTNSAADVCGLHVSAWRRLFTGTLIRCDGQSGAGLRPLVRDARSCSAELSAMLSAPRRASARATARAGSFVILAREHGQLTEPERC